MARLENRFQQRYDESVAKQQKREADGKAPHRTITQSITDNEKRMQMVQMLRFLLVEE